MADPPAAVPSGITVSERDVLLATKLYVPGPRPGLVPRPRLAERLREGLGRGVVLVCAPAGYGKTVLLAEWARSAKRPAAWHRRVRQHAAASLGSRVRGPGRGGLPAQRTRPRAAPLTEGIALCRQFVYTPPLAAGLVTLAWIRQATGDRAGALEAIEEAGQASPVPPGLLNPVPAQRGPLLLAQGNQDGAAQWAQDCGLGADDELDYSREAGHLLLARVLFAQGRPGHALALLDRLNAAAAARDRVGSIIEIGALRALALAASGEVTAAVAALAGALAPACPQGYVRVFADEGPPMAALLGRLVAAQRAGQAAVRVPPGCPARLQRAFDAGNASADPGQTVPAAVPGLVEALTSRELEVLEMLAAGKPNQAIARELVVTLDTVKKHVSHVLGKLGAANRTEAVAPGAGAGPDPLAR